MKYVNFLRKWCLVLTAAALASCGGGQGGDAHTSSSASLGSPGGGSGGSSADKLGASLQGAIRHKLSVSAAPTLLAASDHAVDPADAAEQLMDFAQQNFPQYFPDQQPTQTLDPYLYRYYPGTGIYLGVSAGDVYVLGGPFGDQVVRVGPLTQFITPQARFIGRNERCGSAGLAYAVSSTDTPRVGKNAYAALAGCNGEISDPLWRQTAGPAVVLESHRTQTISFDPPEPGVYSFSVGFVDAQGAAHTEVVSLKVTAAEANTAQVSTTLRASQSARMGDSVSVRAWHSLPSADAVTRTEWTQIEGPAVTLNTGTDLRMAIFAAPVVSADTVIRLRATLHTANGGTDSDVVTVLVEKHPQAAASDTRALWAGDQVSRVYAYLPNGPYAKVLVPCVYDTAQVSSGPGNNLCPLSKLPFLGQETGGAVPTVEQVMNHVVVSHDWLGKNFETFLRTQDTRGDIRRMLMSVTAVVLGTRVRPSHYYAGTGAIYLDADNFWLTPEQRDTVNEEPDYRSEFGSQLQYTQLWRYVENNQSIFTYFDPRARVTRSHQDLRNDAAWLMFHELGHALDFLPPSAYASLDRRQAAWANLYSRYNAYAMTSDTVPASYPLQSSAMFALASVNYDGTSPTAEQKAFSADQVAGFFCSRCGQ